MSFTTKTTLRQQSSTGLPWTGFSLIVAISWMLSLSFTTQQVAIESSPETPSAARFHPFIQMGRLNGLHFMNLDSLSVTAIDGTERFAKASTIGQ